MSVPRYLVERWQAQLEHLFDASDRQDVFEWLIANHDRKRVVLVGSGFTRNARNPHGTPIPMWEDISRALAGDLGVAVGTFDPLSLADFHRKTLGPNAFQAKLLGLLDDSAIQPGAAHAALWDSNPEAVITTNFLDTLLERGSNAQAVIEDPDLALATGPGKSQVIYFHGHRSDFGSWVVGRSDYDDLSDRRPMLFARTRQLFAQFPLLVVGYSLTDPDFHLVYRQMVSAMDRRHPMGLAVMLPRDGQDAEQAQRAAKKYWEDLNLRIVRFRDTKAVPTGRAGRWEDRFADFFQLTRRLENRADVETSYRVAARQEDIAVTFHANVEVMHSAFDDAALGHVWNRSSAAPSGFWLAALNSSLPKASRELASRCAQAYNLEQFPQLTADGTKEPQRKPQDGEHRSELRRDEWDRSGAARADGRFNALWQLLEAQQGRELVWKVNELLRGGVELPTLVRWLRVAVARSDILDEPSIDGTAVMCCLLLVTSWNEPDVNLVQKRASARSSRLADILGNSESPSEVDSPVVALLKQARRRLEAGELELAHQTYTEAADRAASCSEPDAPILSYFALRGCAEATVTPHFSAEELERYARANERSRVAREHPLVRQWWERVERFRSALAKARIERLEQELVRSRYESRSVSFSNSGWQLDVIRQDAVQRGAPLSIEQELAMSLVGAYESEYDELDERLRLGLNQTGQWLSRQASSGDIFRRPSRTLFADRLQAGAAERVQGVQKLSMRLFPSPGDQTVLRRRAIMDVLKLAPRVLCQSDVPNALAEIAQLRRDDPNALLGELLASLSHVCKWGAVKDQILAASEGVLIQDVQHSAERFPWEHWIACDDFLPHGGNRFLELLAGSEVGFPERLSVGWALVKALAAAPDDPELVELSGRFASKVLEQEGQDSSAREQVANLAACSRAFVDGNSGIKARLGHLIDRGDRVVMRILAGALPASDWGERARAALGNTVGKDQSELCLEDIVLATVLDDRQLVDWKVIRAHLEASWSRLSQLAPILTRGRWRLGDWKELQVLLRVGGHRGKPGSWLLGRLDLIVDALGDDVTRSSILDDSPDGLGFLRGSLVEALASGDGIVANRAIYSLAQLAAHVRSDSEAESMATALLSAADDVRINVAHGAAFAANYLIDAHVALEIHQHIVQAAQKVAESLRDDPLAVVQRQAEFGAAKGRQVARSKVAAA